jgi:16S rRNA (guanine1207-N2)-methyltransferase
MMKPNHLLALETLAHVLNEQHDLLASADRIAFLRGMPTDGLEDVKAKIVCEQPFRPREQSLRASGYEVADTLEGPFPLVLVLPERQRHRTLADFARAFALLPEGGTMVVCLHNDWGARRYEKLITAVAGNIESVTKRHCRVFWAKKTRALNTEELDLWSQDYEMRREIEGIYWTRPGIFAWDRIDEGSQLLIDHLPSHMEGTVGDLGCGWGLLSMRILERFDGIKRLDAMDADRDAVEAARRNIGNVKSPARSRAFWHDVSTGIEERHYDWIVMNPPFHEGREPDSGVGIQFIAAAAQGLRSTGELWLVANKHLPYEAVLREMFDVMEQKAEMNNFKVLCARMPRHDILLRHNKRRKGR